jgi:hypothetical protein
MNRIKSHSSLVNTYAPRLNPPANLGYSVPKLKRLSLNRLGSAASEVVPITDVPTSGPQNGAAKPAARNMLSSSERNR